MKILADSKTDKVLGVHIIGPYCGDMIAEMALAWNLCKLTSQDLPCPSNHTEAIKEAALAVDKGNSFLIKKILLLLNYESTSIVAKSF